jgi:magnesium-transporting ATPase (P-type)
VEDREEQEISIQEVEKISTSASKSVFFLLTILLAASVSGQYYNDGDYSSSNVIQGDNYDFGQYDSPRETFGELVAPFLIIALVIQLGIHRALLFTMADLGNREEFLTEKQMQMRHRAQEKEQSRLWTISVIMSLVISGMIVASPMFDLIKTWITWVFGSTIFLLGVGVVGTILWLFYKAIT